MTSSPAVGPAPAAYRDGLAASRRTWEVESAAFGRLGVARAVIFLGIVGAAIGAVLSRGGPFVAVAVGGAVVFLGLVIWHERVARRRERAARSVGYFERGFARLEHRWVDGGDPGDRFRDDEHLYAADLELFGTGSLFHYLSTAGTETGAATLARWLTIPADADTIRARQAAVRELAGRLPLRHDLAVVAGEVGAALDSETLRGWLTAPPARIPAWIGPAAAVVAVVNLAATVAALAGWIPGVAVLPGYLAAIGIAAVGSRVVKGVLRAVDRPARELRILAGIVSRVSAERFESPLLQRSLGALGGPGGGPAEIRRLERLVDFADARRNQLFAPIAGLLLLGTQVAVAVERWRARMGTAAREWLDAIGELEALTSFATLAFEHPDDAFPVVAGPGDPVTFTGTAHPLLPTATAIRNDLELGGPIRLIVVSGSNMSGKSTLLKAVGANLVLGYAGAPVRAAGASLGRWSLGASLVLRESLLEGRSRFYAEVLRIRSIVAAAAAGEPVLFLFDELLSGTNSHDRVIGAEGVLVGLLAKGAVGLVTTHDLALTAIAERPGGANRHLEDTLVDGTLQFDYRLKPGVVRRSNALELMRAVGLDLGAKARSAGAGLDRPLEPDPDA